MGWVNIMGGEELVSMTEERHPQTPSKPGYSDCKKMKHFHVMVEMEDGRSFDGILVDVSGDSFTILISEDVVVDEQGQVIDERQYGYGRRRARRFRRGIYPIAGLATLALFPYAFRPYPYYYPYPYPYYY